jgi:hypothetical protein
VPAESSGGLGAAQLEQGQKMTKQTLSTLVLSAVVSALVLNGCGEESPATGPSTSLVSSAARNMEREDRDREYERRGDDDDDDDDDDRDEESRERTYRSRFRTVVDALRALPALAPLFDRYQVPAPVEYDEDDGLVPLLRAVRITVRSGTVTIVNRRTGGVIFSASLDALAEGVFHPEQMPGGGGVPPPPPQACAFDYTEWSACGPSGTQTRTVAASTPDGCTGTPVTSRSCTYTPPATTCTDFTYSSWGACQPDGSQARSVTSSAPAGCTGGSPVTSQACTYVPPVTTCSSFTYSAWGACQSSNTQSRTVTGSSPAGCTGGSPVTSQACTYVPPVTTCSSFTYSAWGACQSNNTQSRTVTGSSPAGCTGGSPVTSQACTYVPPVCTYTYSAWSACSASGTQTRTVVSSSPSGCAGTPVLSQACTPPTQACGSCHTIPPSTGRHTKHTSFTSCSTCHGTGYSPTTVNSATHNDGVKNIVSNLGYNPSTGTCATAGCHGSRSW